MSIMMTPQKFVNGPAGPQYIGAGYPAAYAGAAPCGAYYGGVEGYPAAAYVPRMIDEQGPYGLKRARGNACLFMTMSLFVPWIIFCIVYCVVSFEWHQRQVHAMNAVCALMFVVVLALGGQAIQALRSRMGRTDPSWHIFLFLTSLISWVVAIFAGQTNYVANMRPFYDHHSLNFYPSIDPSVSEGQQLMDAGRVLFTPETHLDLTKSMGFRNMDMYCVTPIVSASTPASYDFWAVGVNCCAGHASMFQCGEFNNPNAHAGLRLMRDDQRPFFRLAVQQAEAAYNIRANHPIFFEWLSDPMIEVHASEDAGYRYFLLGVFIHFACQLFLVISAYLCITRMGMS